MTPLHLKLLPQPQPHTAISCSPFPFSVPPFFISLSITLQTHFPFICLYPALLRVVYIFFFFCFPSRSLIFPQNRDFCHLSVLPHLSPSLRSPLPPCTTFLSLYLLYLPFPALSSSPSTLSQTVSSFQYLTHHQVLLRWVPRRFIIYSEVFYWFLRVRRYHNSRLILHETTLIHTSLRKRVLLL